VNHPDIVGFGLPKTDHKFYYEIVIIGHYQLKNGIIQLEIRGRKKYAEDEGIQRD
jgi:hypothetical protein